MNWQDLTVEVVGIEGVCPVYRLGDRFRLEQGYKIVTHDSCNVCLHSLGSIQTWAVALSAGVRPEDCGLAQAGEDTAYVRCLDPGPPLTPGGTVTFAIRREPPR